MQSKRNRKQFKQWLADEVSSPGMERGGETCHSGSRPA